MTSGEAAGVLLGGCCWRVSLGWGDPDAFGGGTAERDVASGSRKSEGLIVVAFEQTKFGAGTDAAHFKELEQAAVALVDSADGISSAGRSVGEKGEAAMAATGGAFHFTEIPVRADAIFAELGEKFGFKVRRNGVLEALGFVVNLPPLHSEEFREHTLDQVMAEGELAGDPASGGCEADVPVGEDADEAVLFKAAEGHGDGGSGDLKPIGESGGDNGFAFGLSLEDGFEVVLFGHGDHGGDYTRVKCS